MASVAGTWEPSLTLVWDRGGPHKLLAGPWRLFHGREDTAWAACPTQLGFLVE